MKKLIALFAIVALSFGVSFAGTAPSFAATNAAYESEIDTIISTGNAFDSIATTADTVTFFTKRPMKQFTQYSLVVNTSGTVNFASNLPCFLEAIVYDVAGNEMYTVDNLDSLVSSADEIVELQVGSKILGNGKWTLRAHCHADPGTVSFNKIYLIGRRPITINKPR